MSCNEREHSVGSIEPAPPLNLNDLKDLRDKLDKQAKGARFSEQLRMESLEIEYVPLRWFRLKTAPAEKVVLYLHGGAYVMGSIESHSRLVAELAQTSGFNFLSVAYRLAPENPFPSALYDVLTVYKYLLAEGFKPENIAFAGDSAGAGLALASMLALRERQYPQPAFAILLSAWLDLSMSGDSLEKNASRDPLIDPAVMRSIAAAYLCGESCKNELVSPLFANLDGLAPLLLQVGTYEALLDDSLRLQERGKGFDIEITLEPWEKMTHGWHLSFDSLAEGRKAIDRIGVFMQERWSKGIGLK